MINKEKSATELLQKISTQLAEIHRARDYGFWREETAPLLNAALGGVPPFSSYRDVWIHTADGGYVMTSPRFGEWAIDQLVDGKRPDEIIFAFEAEIDRNVGGYTEVSPVFGVQIDVHCDLGDGIALVPEPTDLLGPLIRLPTIKPVQLPTGTATLHQTFTVTPAFEQRATEDRACSGTSLTAPQSAERDAVRARVRLASILASEGPVELPLTVHQPDRKALLVAGAGNLSGRPFAAHPLVSLPVTAKAVKDNYDALTTFKEIDSLARSIDRLGRARLALSPVDRALELGVAAEIALMHGQGEGNAEITYKIGARAAWLLGRDSDARELIFADMKKLYAARSQAVHSGILSSRSSVDLDAADRLVARVLRTILNRGAFPSWSRLTMGGDPASDTSA